MLSFPMPFVAVPCNIWLPKDGEPDEWNNTPTYYDVEPDLLTTCCYAPHKGAGDIEEGRPHGAQVGMTFYLPKSVTCDLKDALIQCAPPDDSTVSGMRFKVVGMPLSYSRPNTPGDYSWEVEGVEYVG